MLNIVGKRKWYYAISLLVIIPGIISLLLYGLRLSIVQVAEIMKVSKMTIYRYIKAGKLTAIKAGRDFRIRKSDFNKFLERNINK